MPPRSRARTVPAPAYPVERVVLGNGLRVVLAPDRSAPVVGVAVHYDVGFRSEPEGRTGFAHLFEHMMFQGSASVGKMEHPKYVQGAGGTMNGSTHPDYTNYYQALPSNALELALFLEADRMRSVALTEENLANQVAVVQNEIRVNVLNQPYGGFPWILLPPVVFDTFANAHNGYGDFSELEAATLDDCRDFFDRYYAPGNAVLTVCGDLDVAETVRLVEQHFGDIPARPVPQRPSFAEPPLSAPREAVHRDPLAPTPAFCVAHRVPDPQDLPAFLPYVVLADVLGSGDASRLQRRLVQDDRLASSVMVFLGTFGDAFDMRDPTLFQVEVFPSEGVPTAPVLAALHEEVARLAADGLEDGELARVGARAAARVLREVDQVLGRTLAFAQLELLFGRAELVNELPGLLAAVTEEQVRAAASTLTPETRALLEVVPEEAA